MDKAKRRKWARRLVRQLDRFYLMAKGNDLEVPNVIKECQDAAKGRDQAEYDTLLELALSKGAWKTIQGMVLGWDRIER